VDLVINGRTMQALVDSGASHNFLKTEVVKELGLRVSPCGAVVKEVNSKEKETTGVSSSVHIRLDKWEGRANFIVMPMDDFEVILGKEFLRRMHSVLMPWMDKMVILGEQKAWVVCTTARKSGGKVQLVSALSMKRETRWNGSQIYATIVGEVQEDGVGMPVPPELTDLLGDFVDKMSDELSKVLPP
jgi:hypothetical protein